MKNKSTYITITWIPEEEDWRAGMVGFLLWLLRFHRTGNPDRYHLGYRVRYASRRYKWVEQ